MSSAGHSDVVSSAVNIKGEFVRPVSSFRNWITADGSSGFKAERGRYHLYIAHACPWAHRTMIMRKLKGLEDVISVNVVDWLMLEKGWKFSPEEKNELKKTLEFENKLEEIKKPGCTADTENGCEYMRDVYLKVSPGYKGRITVPVLYDKVQKTIVNNESSEIIRMLNTEFNEFCPTVEQKHLDFYPEHLRSAIDTVNDWIYTDINNGVYKSGFARSQEAYDTAVKSLFNALERVEEILSKSRYLTGDVLTEADIRLFTTLIRFDMVYVGHFKCNKHRIKDYPNMYGLLRDIYQTDGIKDTVNIHHITYHYMESHESINPYRIVSIGPDDLDFDTPHNRATLFIKS